MGNRINIINAEIMRAISKIVQTELQNPEIDGLITVTRVETTSDLEYCKVYVSIFSAQNQENVFNQIKHSASYIRKSLSQKINLRKTPYLQFYLDNSQDYGQRIDEVLNKINSERGILKDEN